VFLLTICILKKHFKTPFIYLAAIAERERLMDMVGLKDSLYYCKKKKIAFK